MIATHITTSFLFDLLIDPCQRVIDMEESIIISGVYKYESL